MIQLPAIELLESHHQFPGTFTFKVVGDCNGAFKEQVFAQVRAILNLTNDPQHSVRLSAEGRHQAITLHVEVENAQMVHEIYLALLKLDGLRALF